MANTAYLFNGSHFEAFGVRKSSSLWGLMKLFTVYKALIKKTIQGFHHKNKNKCIPNKTLIFVQT